MNGKKWLIFGVIAVAILGALVYFSGSSSLDVDDVDENAVITANQYGDRNGEIGDRVYGDPNSPVVLIEYADFQCPGCRAAHSRVQLLKEEYGEHIAFVYRHLPLTQIHPHARAAAEAAEAAGQQGMFWEYHDLLYENQNEWSSASAAQRSDILSRYAMELGLDINRWEADFGSDATGQKVRFDLALANKIGAQATPTFVLNGEELSQDVYADDTTFLEAIRAAIIDAGIELDDESED